MDDAENEQYMNRVFIFVAESLTLKPTRPMGYNWVEMKE